EAPLTRGGASRRESPRQGLGAGRRETPPRRLGAGEMLSGLAQAAAFLLIAATMLFPLFWMLASSVKTPQELQASPPVWLPAEPNLAAYGQVFEVVRFGRSFLNS